jgi:hypothetical protein
MLFPFHPVRSASLGRGLKALSPFHSLVSDFFVLDTDPTPEPRISSPSCLQLLSSGLRNYVNAPDFADVTFVVEGKTIYGHKIVLSLLSDRSV